MDPVFDINALDEWELGHLEYIVNSPSYAQVMRPFLEKCRQTYINLGLNPVKIEREKYGGEDYLRCGANNIGNFIGFLDKILAETRHERAMAARAKISQEDMYREAVETGRIRQAGQVKDDYAPDEEF